MLWRLGAGGLCMRACVRRSGEFIGKLICDAKLADPAAVDVYNLSPQDFTQWLPGTHQAARRVQTCPGCAANQRSGTAAPWAAASPSPPGVASSRVVAVLALQTAPPRRINHYYHMRIGEKRCTCEMSICGDPMNSL